MALSQKLVKACQNGQYGVVRHLFHEGFKNWTQTHFNPDDLDETGKTLLDYAIEADDAKMIGVLFENGVDIEKPDTHSRTPLLRAIEANRPQAALKLIETGANYNAADYFGVTPLIAVCDLPREVFAAVPGSIGMQEVLNVLVRFKDIVVNAPDAQGETPLIKASWRKNLGALERLVQAGADLNARNKKGLSALDIACARKDEEAAAFLIRSGTTLSLSNKKDVALKQARRTKMRSVIQMLKQTKEELRDKRRQKRIASHLPAYNRAFEEQQIRIDASVDEGASGELDPRPMGFKSLARVKTRSHE